MFENLRKMPYGGDYNPEQWDEETWQEDIRLLKLAHVDTLTVNVFSWALLQKDENTYDFSTLDKIMKLARENGMNICLATSTAAHPAWMAKKYPDILRTEFNGLKRKFGGRHNSCPNSVTYRKYSVLLAEKIAQRYKDCNNIIAWHISNEYGGACYCENCEKAFREWLKKKYSTLEVLNKVWNTAFWGHTFYDWDEIVAPNLLSEHFEPERSMFQGISLDYARFNSDSILDCYRLEYEAVKRITPNIPVTTNLMGFYKPLDYQKWANYMDFISWDNYPSVDQEAAETAMRHDLMRGLKQGQPFFLMEQTPSVSNWHHYCALKRPGVMRLWSYQAVAHGSDSVMFFQMKRSIGACEKYHSAVIDHAGNEYTRVFRECQALGKELEIIGNKTMNSRLEAKAAILFDWDNWWAVEFSAGPSCDLKYYDEILNYYKPFYENNIPVDIIGVNDDLSKYKLVIAPLFYMVKGDFDRKIKEFTGNGGTFVTTFFSGIVDEHDLVTIGGYPGKLRDLLGIWVEEIDALPEETANSFDFDKKEYTAKLLCDIMHLEGAEALAVYKKDFYKNTPVITKNKYGKGTAYYIGTRSQAEFYNDFFCKLCAELQIEEVMKTPKQIEAAKRQKGNGTFLFLLNHSEEESEVILDADYQDLLSGRHYQKGLALHLKTKETAVLKEVK